MKKVFKSLVSLLFVLSLFRYPEFHKPGFYRKTFKIYLLINLLEDVGKV